MAALATVQRSGRLPPAALLERIGPVLADAPAGTAKASLRLVGGAGASSPDFAHRAAVVAADALANPSPDVQRAAVALIGTLAKEGAEGAEGGEAIARAVAHRLADVAASQRPAATELVARLGGAGPAPSPARSTVIAEGPPAGAGTATPAPRTASPTDPERAIEPLATIDALVDVAVSVLESGEPADDVERVLDAVGRLAGDRSGQFDRLTAAVARRARVILGRRDSHVFTGFDAASDVAAVLLAWATGDVVEPAAAHRSVDPGAGAFLSARARELAEAVAAGRSFAGVAAPTHRGGWIEPAVLVRRLRDRPPASLLDLVAAILRLAPGGRDSALDAASDLGGEAGAAVRYALGGDEAIGATAPWWVAAARVRAPGQDDERVERRHPRLGPDAGRAARVRLHARDGQPSFAGLWLEIEPALVEVHPRPSGGVGVDLPTVEMLRNPSSFAWTGRSEPAMLRWMATIQPGYRETWAAIGSLRARSERRLVVGRVGQPSVPRAVRRPGRRPSGPTRAPSWGSPSARRRRASAVSRATSCGPRSMTAAWPGRPSPRG